jgi:hypothetical protein
MNKRKGKDDFFPLRRMMSLVCKLMGAWAMVRCADLDPSLPRPGAQGILTVGWLDRRPNLIIGDDKSSVNKPSLR